MKHSWEGALERWRKVVPYDYEVGVQERGAIAPKPGEWWLLEDHWCVQLDEHHYARFLTTPPSDELRDALSYTVQQLKRTVDRSWREVITAWFVQRLTGNSHDGAAEADGTASNLFVAEHAHAFAKLLPGYFVWVHPDFTPTRRQVTGIESSAEQVVRAILPKGWVGWVAPGPGIPYSTMLLFYAVGRASTDAHPNLEAESESSSVDYVELLSVHEELQSLLAQLESEVYFSAKAVVGCKVTTAAEALSGLETVFSTWQVESRRSTSSLAGVDKQGRRVCSFGTTPVEHLLLNVPRYRVQEFIDISGIRSPSGAVELTAELVETLQGIVAANLNVSEAARILYLHRNTLLHRIEKIQQLTGYDIRNFRDALVLWLLQQVDPPHE